MHRALAALILACCATVAPEWAVCASAQAASLFQEVEVRQPPRAPHTGSWIAALAGAGLVTASFPLATRADRLYERYQRETDVSRIDERYRATARADRLASAALVSGEVLLVAAVYLRFVRRPAESPVALELEPARCAVTYRF